MRSFVWIYLLCPSWGLGCLVAKMAIETPTTRRNLEKFQGWPVTRSDTVTIRDITWQPVGPGTCKRAGPNSTNVAFVVAVKVRVSGYHQIGMSWGHFPRLPLIFVNIMISLLVKYQVSILLERFLCSRSKFRGMEGVYSNFCYTK
jgi:hypothetical protein